MSHKFDPSSVRQLLLASWMVFCWLCTISSSFFAMMRALVDSLSFVNCSSSCSNVTWNHSSIIQCESGRQTTGTTRNASDLSSPLSATLDIRAWLYKQHLKDMSILFVNQCGEWNNESRSGSNCRPASRESHHFSLGLKRGMEYKTTYVPSLISTSLHRLLENECFRFVPAPQVPYI